MMTNGSKLAQTTTPTTSGKRAVSSKGSGLVIVRQIVGGLCLMAMLWTLVPMPEASAQCPMCRANVEAARKLGVRKIGNGLNDGILLLLAMPYLLAGTFGGALYYYYRKQKKKEAAEEEKKEPTFEQ